MLKSYGSFVLFCCFGLIPMAIAQVQTERGALPIPPNLTGSVSTGQPTPETLPLSLLDAIERGLKYNIGVVDSAQDIRATRAERLRALRDLLPDVRASLTATGQQVNLAAFGFSGIPGLPSVIGPFATYDARAFARQSVFDLNARRTLRAREEDQKVVERSAADIREQVVLVVTGLYLQAVAGTSRIQSAAAQVTTAQALLKNAQDRKDAGTSPAIDVLRAQVQLQSLQQRQIFYEGDNQKQFLSLARAIGLPPGQKIVLTDPNITEPLPPATLDEMLKSAYANRRDYQAAQAAVHAAELDKAAAHAEKYPTAEINGNYGTIGLTPWSQHGTFAVAGGINIPIFQGGKVEADELAADATLKKRQAALENLRGQIDNEVRTAVIDTQNAFRQVEVARSSIQLARQQLTQSQDRFRAGVTNNLEVVQAQEAVATADENLISSLFGYNIARATLVRAEGVAEQYLTTYLKGK